MPTKRVRIGIDGREFTGRKTGISRLLEGALKEFPRLRSDWEFFLFGNQETIPPFEAKAFTFLRFPERLTPWWDQVLLVRSLRKEKIDLFLSPYYKIPLFSPCPAISILHDCIILTSPCYRSPRYLLKRSVSYLLGFFYARRANLILTDSFYSKVWIRRLFKVPEDKIRVVYPGLDKRFLDAHITHSLDLLKQKHHFSSPYLLYVGNFKPHKRVDCLLQAYGRLPEALRNQYPLLLVGRLGAHGVELKKMAERLGLSESTFFTDYVDDETLIALYKEACLFLFPSSEEGFGLPPVEAMAFGVPVIASRAASIPEIVGDAASLVSPGNAEELSLEMRRFLEDETLRQSFTQKGARKARSFTVEAQAQEMICAIEHVLDRKP